MRETRHQGFMPSSNPSDGRSLADLIHAEGCTTLGTLRMACFVGLLAPKSGAAGIDEVLGDAGLIPQDRARPTISTRTSPTWRGWKSWRK